MSKLRGDCKVIGCAVPKILADSLEKIRVGEGYHNDALISIIPHLGYNPSVSAGVILHFFFKGTEYISSCISCLTGSYYAFFIQQFDARYRDNVFLWTIRVGFYWINISVSIVVGKIT